MPHTSGIWSPRCQYILIRGYEMHDMNTVALRKRSISAAVVLMLLPERAIGARRHQIEELIIQVIIHVINWCPIASVTDIINLRNIGNNRIEGPRLFPSRSSLMSKTAKWLIITTISFWSCRHRAFICVKTEQWHHQDWNHHLFIIVRQIRYVRTMVTDCLQHSCSLFSPLTTCKKSTTFANKYLVWRTAVKA